MKHTPGPWKNIDGIIHASATDQAVCQMWNKYEDDFRNHEANAALIEAAPELAEALLEWVNVPISCIAHKHDPAPIGGCDCWACERTRMARTALQKAKVAIPPIHTLK